MAEQIMITIVDDEQDMRESISQWLSLSGYKTVTYASADLALKNIDLDYPGIIISDIKMPGTDGISFLKKFNKLNCGSKEPLLTIITEEITPIAIVPNLRISALS